MIPLTPMEHLATEIDIDFDVVARLEAELNDVREQYAENVATIEMLQSHLRMAKAKITILEEEIRKATAPANSPEVQAIAAKLNDLLSK